MRNTRYLAYKIVYDVKHKDKYSNILLNKMLEDKNLSKEDRGFITFLVYGTLSRICYLDYFIKKISTIPFRNISKKVKVILEISFFQKYFMNIDADYAIVNEAVKICKKEDRRAYKFVNGLLRGLPEKLAEDEIFSKNKIENLHIKYSVDKSIAERLIKNYGEKFVIDFLESMYNTPRLYIRANSYKVDFEEFVQKLEKNKIDYEIIEKKHMIFAVKSLNNVKNNPLFKEGLFSIQDYASMKSIIMMDIKKGDKVLDTCCAPGSKSIFISQFLQNTGEVVGFDISREKLDKFSHEIKRLGINNISTDIQDGRFFREDLVEKFDKILCDVPCTGLGVIRRKPEIRYKNIDNIDELREIQYNILENASKYLKKGGTLCYSTCTVGYEENDATIEKFLEKNENFVLHQKKEYYPHIDNTDGFFVCIIKKVG